MEGDVEENKIVEGKKEKIFPASQIMSWNYFNLYLMLCPIRSKNILLFAIIFAVKSIFSKWKTRRIIKVESMLYNYQKKKHEKPDNFYD